MNIKQILYMQGKGTYDNILKIESSCSENSDQSDQPDLQYDSTNSHNCLHYLKQLNEQIGSAYRFVKKIYHSQLSDVWIVCNPTGNDQNYRVLKISRNAQKEIKILEQLKKYKLNTPNLEAYGQQWILMCRLDGDISQIIKKNGVYGLQPSVIHKLIQKIGSSLIILHNNGYIHGDIKPTNILYEKIENQYDFYLSDFGNSFQTSQIPSVASQTINYRAPEWQTPNTQLHLLVSPKIDVWGLGCVIFECMTNQKLYPDQFSEDIHQLNQKDLMDELFQPPRIKVMLQRFSMKKSNQIFGKMIFGMLERNPHERLSLIDVLNYCDDIQKCRLFYGAD